MKRKIVSLKFDYCFKELFANGVVRKQFIADVLGIPPEQIRSTRLLNTFLGKRYYWQKQGILDILTELNDDTKINIELQIARQAHWIKRNLYYLAKMFTDDLKTGEDYTRLKRCICISILDFNLTDGDEYHHVYRFRDEDAEEWTDLFEVHIIELNKPLAGDGRLDDWIRLINATTEEELEMIQAKSAGMAEAVKEVKLMRLSRKMKLIYEQWLKDSRDRRAIEEYERERIARNAAEDARIAGEKERIAEENARIAGEKDLIAEEKAHVSEREAYLIEEKLSIEKKVSEIKETEFKIKEKESEIKEKDRRLEEERERNLRSAVMFCQKNGMSEQETIAYMADILRVTESEAEKTVKKYL